MNTKERWINCEPDKGLTWGEELNCEDFIEKVGYLINNKSRILEIGPGYGRVFDSLLKSGFQYEKYTMIDISFKNVEFLKEKYKNVKNLEIVNGDIENYIFNNKFDLVFSVATFKHIYPSFNKVLTTLKECLVCSGMLVFDLIEGDDQHFEPLGNFLRKYSLKEVENLLKEARFLMKKSDYVYHKPNDESFKRLLIFAENQ